MNYMDVAVEAANKAAQVIENAFVDVDWQAQAAIVDTIKVHFPNHDIIAEEGRSIITGSPYVWVVDPLDGTYNCMAGLPLFCISIALQHRGETVLGLVKDLSYNRLFTSQGKKRRASKTGRLADAMIAVDWPASEARAQTLEVVGAIAPKVKTLRSLGSSALSLCYMAQGWLDGFIHVDIEPWDAAAGALIVQNAGGKVTDFAGRPWQTTSRQLVASNGLLHDEMLTVIQEIK